jgi:hypothetical protein
MNVTTNNKPRPLLTWEDIPVAHRETWLDYVEEGERQDHRFFKYGDWWFDTHEFCLARGDLAQLGWAVWQTQSAFDAVLVKYSEDYESVVVAHAAW